jgi:hypothetical protein
MGLFACNMPVPESSCQLQDHVAVEYCAVNTGECTPSCDSPETGCDYNFASCASEEPEPFCPADEAAAHLTS